MTTIRGTGWSVGLAGALLLCTGSAADLAAQQECCEEVADRTADKLTLEEAVRVALERNRQIRTARYQLEEARERANDAWGNLYPSLDLNMTYTRNLSPAVNFVPARFFDPEAPIDEQVPLQFGADNAWNGTLSAEQILFDGAAFVGVGAAGRFKDLQTEVLRGRVQNIVTEVRTAYYDLLLAQEETRLTENSVRRVEESLEETRALNRAGLASDYDVLRLEVELANLRPDLLRARNSVRDARRTLAVALDLEDADGLEVEGSLAEMDIVAPAENSEANRRILAFGGVELGSEIGTADVQALVDLARENRSDVRQLELTESLRETELRLEEVEYLPELSIFGTYGVNSSQNGSPDFFGSPRAYTRQVGVQLTFPVFRGFQRDARVDEKRAVVRAARAQTSLARHEAATEVQSLVDRLDEARATAAAQSLAVEQARRGFEIARAQFREGLGSQLELTDSEVALRESEFNYAQAVYDFLVARARLDQATGRVPLAATGGGSGAGGGEP